MTQISVWHFSTFPSSSSTLDLTLNQNNHGPTKSRPKSNSTEPTILSNLETFLTNISSRWEIVFSLAQSLFLML